MSKSVAQGAPRKKMQDMSSRLLVFTALCAASASAQISSFPKPSYFRETFARPVTKVEAAAASAGRFVVEEEKKLELRSSHISSS
jgi:hypothetical protein